MSTPRILAGSLVGTAVLLLVVPLGAAQEPPDTVVSLAPLVIRVLTSALGTGSAHPVSVVGAEELQRGSVGAFLEDALRSLPGLQIQNRFNLASGERLAVRGFGSRAQFGIRGVRIFVDGIPATLPDGQTSIDHLDIANLARVEFLRGPGSTMYGNAAGGVLHFESLPPSQREPEGELRAAGGSNGLRSYAGNWTGSAGGTGYRIGLSRFTYDGFRTNPVPGDGSTYGGANRTIFSGGLSRPLGEGFIRIVFNGLELDAENAGSLTQTLLGAGDRQAQLSSVLQRAHEDIRQGQAGVTWSGTFGSAHAELSAWGVRREFVGRIPPRIVAFDRNTGGVRALLRRELESGLGPFSFGSGFEVELQRDDRQNWENEEGEKGAQSLDQLERVRNVGLFVQGRQELGNGLAAEAGLRYDHFSFEARDRFLQDETDDSGSRVMDALSPSFGMVWVQGPHLELFGTVATSFETPTTTELSNRPTGAGGLNPALDPTRGLTIEGGFRARYRDRWRIEGTAFRTQLEKELVPFEVPSTPGRSDFRNSGSSYHQGWEGAVEGRPSDWAWLPALAYTRVDARFDSYVVDGEDLSGNRIPGLSPHRLDGRILVRGGGAFAELRGLYEEAVPVDDQNVYASPAHFIGDLRVGWTQLETGPARLSPFVSVSNILDRRYNAAVVVNAFGARFFEPGPGRALQAGVTAVFRR